jgi:hypothetical protein
MRVRFAMAMAMSLSIAWACGSFSSSEDPPPGVDASTSDAPAGDSNVDPDGAVTDAGIDAPAFDLEVRPACPRPAAGTACTGLLGTKPCVSTKLFDPPTAEHVFGIVADRRHLFWLAQPAVPDGGSQAYNGNGTATLRRFDLATSEVVELARDELHATVLFAYGPHLFWAVQTAPGSNLYAIRMMRKDAAPCAPAGCSLPTGIATGMARIHHLGALTSDRLFAVESNGALSHVTIEPPDRVLLGTATPFPGFVVGDRYVYLGGGFQTGVERYDVDGVHGADLGDLPDASLGAVHLSTSCSAVFSRGDDNRVLAIDASAEGGAFTQIAALGTPFPVYAVASDARFLYYGAANEQGFRRVDHTVQDASTVEIATGSVWGIAVTDDAIFYGEHGGLGSITAPGPEVGSIFSIAK